MPAKRFILVKRNIYENLKESNNLLDIWKYIKKEIKDPENYLIDEFTGKSFTDCYFVKPLMENCKTKKDVIQLLNDMENLQDCKKLI